MVAVGQTHGSVNNAFTYHPLACVRASTIYHMNSYCTFSATIVLGTFALVH